MKLSLGFSPCPNDTFIFDALVNKKIDTEGLDFEVHLEDVQTLNNFALENRFDFSKISYGVLPLLLNTHTLLNSGGAMGIGVGPLLICKDPHITPDEVNHLRIAIPGKNTTAYLLFSYAYPDAKNISFYVFNEIESAVLSGEVDAGVIIHENRFTYAQKGLYKITDLGAEWETKTKSPIALGGIVASNRIPKPIMQQVDQLIAKSVAHAFNNYPSISEYVSCNAQEMSEAVMRQHIDLYVNDFSSDMGETGKNAIVTLVDIYQQMNATTSPTQPSHSTPASVVPFLPKSV
jgi:1,4-dihydroxy-6-naphthoate synthase